MKKPDGQVVVGTLSADNQTLAAQQIREIGGVLLDLTRTGPLATRRQRRAVSPFSTASAPRTFSLSQAS